jgi:ribosomal-protein-alanine acetyltransferase
MKNILIQQAHTQDLDGLVKLEQECFTEDRMNKNNFRHLLSGKTAEIFVAKNASEVIGSAVVLFRKRSKKARIYSFAVHPEFRALGVALELNKEIEKKAVTRGCDVMILEVRFDNSRAIKFYEKLDYKKSGTYEGYYEDGHDALRMIKTLV